METNYSYPTFSINRGTDLVHSQFDILDLSCLPWSALLNCNEIVVSLLKGNDIQDDIEKGVNADGITEKSPFFSPLVWVALVYVLDWEQEKKFLRKLLLSKIDCNYVGLCGFNLFHVYLVQSLFSPTGFEKLRWWVDKPMVDCNMFSLSLHDRPAILMVHPAQLISRIATQFSPHKQHVDNVLSYLVSRGMSCHYLPDDWKPPPQNADIAQRFQKQTIPPPAPPQQQRRRRRHYKKEQSLPTPQMNNLDDIDHDQHLTFSSSKGLRFRFHASYMDPILRTHKFPFTMEPIETKTLKRWNAQCEKQWMPREEFLHVSTPFLCHDKYMDVEKMFIHLLNQWVCPLYPYSRIMMLSAFPLTDTMYEYLCLQMRSSMFHLTPFHKKRHPTTPWKHFFLWACYDCVHEFLFANQMEQLVSQLEIFYSWTTPFQEQFPDVESFIQQNAGEATTYNVFSEEFDHTMFQVYHLFKKMSLFMKKSGS